MGASLSTGRSTKPIERSQTSPRTATHLTYSHYGVEQDRTQHNQKDRQARNFDRPDFGEIKTQETAVV